MKTRPWKFFATLVLLLIAVGSVPLLRQRETTLMLCREIDSLRQPKPESIQPLAENSRLKALQISETELRNLEKDQEAFIRLRDEGKAISESLSQRARKQPPRKLLPVRAW